MNIDAILALIWTIAIWAAVFYILWWGLGKLGLGEPFGKIATIVLVALTVLVAIGLLLGRTPMIPFCQVGSVNPCGAPTALR